MREGLGSPHLDSRRAGALPLELHRALGDPAAAGEHLRHRVRPRRARARPRAGRRRPDPRPAPAQGRPPAGPEDRRRLPEGEHARAERRPGGALRARPGRRLRRGARGRAARRAAGAGAGAGGRLRGGRAAAAGAAAARRGRRRAAARSCCCGASASRPGRAEPPGARALLAIAEALEMAATPGAGLLEVPLTSNGRGLREAGVLPNAGPGLSEPAAHRRGGRTRRAARSRAALADGELSCLYLLHTDPLEDFAQRELWERALHGAGSVIAHSAFLTEGIRDHADVVFPAEVYAEKEGTIVHPDGRLQRLRPAIARPAERGRRVARAVRAGAAARHSTSTCSAAAMASRQLFEAVPFYGGLTLEEIGGRGVRWQQREAAGSFPAGDPGPARRRRRAGALRGRQRGRRRAARIPLAVGRSRGPLLPRAGVPVRRAGARLRWCSRPSTTPKNGGSRSSRRSSSSRSPCSSCRSCCSPSASCWAACRTATAPTASARSGCSSRSPTSSSC